MIQPSTFFTSRSIRRYVRPAGQPSPTALAGVSGYANNVGTPDSLPGQANPYQYATGLDPTTKNAPFDPYGTNAPAPATQSYIQDVPTPAAPATPATSGIPGANSQPAAPAISPQTASTAQQLSNPYGLQLPTGMSNVGPNASPQGYAALTAAPVYGAVTAPVNPDNTPMIVTIVSLVAIGIMGTVYFMNQRQEPARLAPVSVTARGRTSHA